MKRPRVLMACGALASLLLHACGGSKASQPTGFKKGGDGVPVSVARVLQKDVPLEIRVIGNVEAYATITVKAQVGGELTQAHFKEGDYVKKGELLFTIDPRQLEASLAQAEANLARDVALETQAQATLTRDLAQEKYVHAQAARFERLFKEGVISKDQTDQYQTNAEAVSAAVAADRAAIESARAATVAAKAGLENMKLQLAYTSIRSPIDGRTGNLNVKQGNIVSANTSELMTVNQVQPIYVTFSIPEAQLPQVKQYMAEGRLPVNATPQEDGAPPETGYLTFVDNTVDSTTGTIKLKGTFGNEDLKLWPGEFVRVVLRLTTQRDALVVPNQAVQTGQEGQFVYVVREDRTVESRAVVPGPRVDQDLVLNSGVKAGEMVVTEGHLRLAPGSRVTMRGQRAGGKGGPGEPGGRPGGFRKGGGEGGEAKAAPK